jgi:exopolysaccharide biosynthesis polyprenyl glycosylphosphotransferase
VLRGGLWAPIDGLAAALSMLLAFGLSPVFLGDVLGPKTLRAALVHAVSFVLVASVASLYDRDAMARRSTLLWRSLLSAVASAALTLGFHYLVFYEPIGRRVIASTIALSAPLIVLPRLALWRLLHRRRRRILFVDPSPLAARIARALEGEPESLLEVVGCWRDGAFHPRPDAGVVPVAADELEALCRVRDVDEVILPSHGSDLRASILPALRCLPLGCLVRSEADFYEDAFRAVPVTDVTPEWMLSRGLDTSNHLAEVLKRLSDVVLALVILVLSAPVALVAALLIGLAGDGPVFYSQTRVGRYGRPFRILKFRSMRVDAEQGRAQWAREDDPRQTSVGRILRRTRMDELPQIVNVLVGDMSFVGPRPERPEFVERLEPLIPFYAWRHLVRPGLTGWAQINCPYGASVDDARRKLEYDLYYIRHYSPPMDLAIVLRTVTAAVGRVR